MQTTLLRESPRLPTYFPSILSTFHIHVSWEPDQSYHVMPVSLIALVPTVLEKSVFYRYLAVASVSLGLPTQFVHFCLVTARAFMPASLIVLPYTTLEISKFLGQLPVDDDDEKSQLNPSIASLRSELS